MSVLESLLRIDCGSTAESAVSFISESVKDAKASGVVMGLSGGLDSAVCAALCARSCDTTAMMMPDSAVTPDSEMADAREVARVTGVHTKVTDIGPIVAEFAKGVAHNDASLGNVRARIRMAMLYNHANLENVLVAGTSDKSELLIGYFTKHGDGASDIAPIATLYKVQVREMAGHLGIPRNIIDKKSAPYLSNARTAEDEIGLTYEEIDPILYCMVDRGMDDAGTSDSTGIDSTKVAHVRRLYESSRHKRAGSAGATMK